MIENDQLFNAFRTDAPEMVQTLLAGSKAHVDGPFPWTGFKGRESPTEVAALLGAVKVLRWLLDAGASPNKKGRSIPLIAASGADKLDCVRVLMEAGADPNVKEGRNDENDSGWTALMYACSYGNVAMARVLLDAGADPNAVSKKGLCATALASEQRSLEIWLT